MPSTMFNYIGISMLALCVKLFLIDSYRSTDFEVHRNWMALTQHLPIHAWYFDHTSKWTLDYPPFFAYFEWALSQIAIQVDPNIVTLSAKPLVTTNILLFQRGSVIVCDLLLLIATVKYLEFDSDVDAKEVSRRKKDDDAISSSAPSPSLPLSPRKKTFAFSLIALNAGLFLIDHIHFQYNGLLIGLLVTCLSLAQRQMYLCVAIVFSVLVLTKHLFVTLVPLFAVYLWRAYCSPVPSASTSTVTVNATTFQKCYRFGALACIACLAISAAVGPFIWAEMSLSKSMNPPRLIGTPLIERLQLFSWTHNFNAFYSASRKQLSQIISRLLPFDRGLVHTYWAPNMWALYYAYDRVLGAFVKFIDIVPDILLNTRGAKAMYEHHAHSASGMLGHVKPEYLPAISASMCLILTCVAMLPALIATYRRPTTVTLVRAVVYCSMCSFMLGYHVHEKAILIPMIVQTLLIYNMWGIRAGTGTGDGTGTGTVAPAMYLYYLLSTAGIFAMFPLFTAARELYVKTAFLIVHIILVYRECYYIQQNYGNINSNSNGVSPASYWQIPAWLVALILASVHVYIEFIHASLEQKLDKKLEFLPLMLTSTVCAVMLMLAWALSLAQVLAAK